MKVRTWRRIRRLGFLVSNCVMMLWVSLACCDSTLAVQIKRIVKLPPGFRIVPPVIPPVAIARAATQDENPEKIEPTLDTHPVQDNAPEIGEQFAQFHLLDGSIIGGDIEVESIDVNTVYGMLNVPISRIVQIHPGLNSRPELMQKITQLVDELGGPSANDRDAAQKELISMGVQIRNVLKQLASDGNAERNKRIAQIQARFEEEIEARQEELIEIERLMIFDDTVVTPDFSIVGKIQQQQFDVKSKFGDLRVKLGDIEIADRAIELTRPDVRKTVSVPAMAFFQTKPQSTGIRVNKGDKISIRADGIVQWTNWNSSSTPEGLTNRSQWNGINSGKLAARIGTDNSRCVQIGSSGNFVAHSSGILYLGIAMRDSYATNSGYSWTGEYKAKINISPKGN